MKIDDYKHADCALFRIPPIDFSKVEEVIQYALIEAWKNGTSASRAIDHILYDGSIIDQLSEQISDNLDFQKTVALDQLDAKQQEGIADCEMQKEQVLAEVERTFGKEVVDRERAKEETSSQVHTKTKVYTAAQARLNEMRARIEVRLNEVGGRERFEKLMKINESVYGAKAKRKAKSKPKTPISAEYGSVPSAKKVSYSSQNLNRALDLATAKGTVDPLRGDTLEDLVGRKRFWQRKNLDGKTGFWYRVLKKVKKVRYYKLW